MQSMNRFRILPVALIVAYFLASCSGSFSQPTDQAAGSRQDTNVVAFTGIVESIVSTEWTVSGQKIRLAPQAALDAGIAVGDEVRVEASVSADGAVLATTVESLEKNASTSARSVELIRTPDLASTALPDGSFSLIIRATPDATNTPMISATQISAEIEVVGIVEAITADTITINSVTYQLSSTQLQEPLFVGDQVRLRVTIHANGLFTVRTLERVQTMLHNSGSSDHDSHDDSDHHSDHDHGGSCSGNCNDD